MNKKLVYKLLLKGRHLFAKVGILVSSHSTTICHTCLDMETGKLTERLVRWYGCKLVKLSNKMVDSYISYSRFVSNYGKGLI